MKRKMIIFLFVFILVGCQKATVEDEVKEKSIVVGFSQSGTESNWRKKHTQSIREELEKRDYQVLYRNGFMNQERQIQDIRTFIAHKVDVIIFTPLKETGWEPVLKEAQKANIKVIVVDRHIKVTDENLFLTHIGPSFKAEGNRAGLYVRNHFDKKGVKQVNILELSGLTGTSPTTLRSEGFLEAINWDDPENPDLKMEVTATIQGDFIRKKGEEAMLTYIEEHGLSDIDVLYSHSDEMTLGAIEALKTTNIVPGKDIVIVTIDGQAEIIKLLKNGTVNCVVECNPNAGWFVANTVERFFSGKENNIAKEIYMPETVFSDQNNLKNIPTRNY